MAVHGAPRYLRYYGPGFIATALLLWLQTAEIDTTFIDPDKPWQNGTDESFNGRFREECLSVQWFALLEDAQQKIDAFRWDYNKNHPHRALKGLSPNEHARRSMTTAADSLA